MISAPRLPIAPSPSLFMIPIAPIIPSLEGVSKWRKCALRRIENHRRQISQIHPKSFILCISTLIC